MNAYIIYFIIYIIVSLVIAILFTKFFNENLRAFFGMFLLWPICLPILFCHFISKIQDYKSYCAMFLCNRCYLRWFADQVQF